MKTEDYLSAIAEKRNSGKSVSVDFSQLPEGVDTLKVAQELTKGLPRDYIQEVLGRHDSKGSVKLDYGEIRDASMPPVAVTAAKAAGQLIGHAARLGRDGIEKIGNMGLDILSKTPDAINKSLSTPESGPLPNVESPTVMKRIHDMAHAAEKDFKTPMSDEEKAQHNILTPLGIPGVAKAFNILGHQIQEASPEFAAYMQWEKRSKLGTLSRKLEDYVTSVEHGNEEAAKSMAPVEKGPQPKWKMALRTAVETNSDILGEAGHFAASFALPSQFVLNEMTGKAIGAATRPVSEAVGEAIAKNIPEAALKSMLPVTSEDMANMAMGKEELGGQLVKPRSWQAADDLVNEVTAKKLGPLAEKFEKGQIDMQAFDASAKDLKKKVYEVVYRQQVGRLGDLRTQREPYQPELDPNAPRMTAPPEGKFGGGKPQRPMPMEPSEIAKNTMAVGVKGEVASDFAKEFPFVSAAAHDLADIPKETSVRWQQAGLKDLPSLLQAYEAGTLNRVQMSALDKAIFEAAAKEQGAHPDTTARLWEGAQTAAKQPAETLVAHHAEKNVKDAHQAYLESANKIMQTEAGNVAAEPTEPLTTALAKQEPGLPEGSEATRIPGKVEALGQAAEAGAPLQEVAEAHRDAALEAQAKGVLDPEVAAEYASHGDTSFDPIALEAESFPMPHTGQHPGELSFEEFQATYQNADPRLHAKMVEAFKQGNVEAPEPAEVAKPEVHAEVHPGAMTLEQFKQKFPGTPEDVHKTFVQQLQEEGKEAARVQTKEALAQAGVTAQPLITALKAHPISEKFARANGISGDLLAELKRRGVVVAKKLSAEEGGIDAALTRIKEENIPGFSPDASVNDLVDSLENEIRQGTKKEAETALIQEEQKTPYGEGKELNDRAGGKPGEPLRNPEAGNRLDEFSGLKQGFVPPIGEVSVPLEGSISEKPEFVKGRVEGWLNEQAKLRGMANDDKFKMQMGTYVHDGINALYRDINTELKKLPAEQKQDFLDNVNNHPATMLQKSLNQMFRDIGTAYPEQYAKIPHEPSEAKKLLEGFKPIQKEGGNPEVKEPNLPYGVPQTQTQEFKNWFGDSKVVDEQGKPLVVYHGSKRPDRIGSRFRKSRATSGPMAFFTDDPNISSSYATNKADTSRLNEGQGDYAEWFKFKPKGSKNSVSIDKAWLYLSPEEKERISSLAPRVTTTDDGEQIVLGETSHKTGLGGYDQHLKESHGNHLKALVEEWLSSGHLYNTEEDFSKVLDLAGMAGAKFDSPYIEKPAVIPAYLSIKNPLQTNSISPNVVQEIEKASNRQRPISPESIGVDTWDKTRRDAREWTKQLKEDIAKKENSHVWTSIPDWVTKTLKNLGYDGIQDIGGKFGVLGHGVWIPFEESQVKSAIGNKGTFSHDDPNILRENVAKQEYADESSKAFGPQLDPKQIEVDLSLDQKSQMAKQFRETGKIDYAQVTVNDARDVYEIASVRRHEGIEHNNFVLTKQGKIVSHLTFSSGLPNAVQITEEQLKTVEAEVARTGADGVSSAHNHPTEVHEPSTADVSTNSMLSQRFGDKYKGMVIIDDVEGSYLAANSNTPETFKFSKQLEKINQVGGDSLQNRRDVIARATQDAQMGQSHIVLYLDAQNRVMLMESHAKGENIPAKINSGIIQNKASGAVVVAPEPLAASDLPKETLDIIHVDKDGKITSPRSEMVRSGEGPSAYGPLSSWQVMEDKPRYMGGQGMDADDFAKALEESKVTIGSTVTARVPHDGFKRGEKLKVLGIDPKGATLIVQSQDLGGLPYVTRPENLVETYRKPAAREALEVAQEANQGPSQLLRKTVEEQQAGLAAKEKITLSVRQALNARLRAESFAARAAARATKAELINKFKERFDNLKVDFNEDKAALKAKYEAQKVRVELSKDEIVKYIKATLPPNARGKFLDMVRNVESPIDVQDAFLRVDAEAALIYKKGVIDDINKLAIRASDSPSVAIEDKKRIRAFMDELTAGKPTLSQKMREVDDYFGEAGKDGNGSPMTKYVWHQLRRLGRGAAKDLPESFFDEVHDRLESMLKAGLDKQWERDTLRDLDKQVFLEKLQQAKPPKHEYGVRKRGTDLKKISLYDKIFTNKWNAVSDWFQKNYLAIMPIDASLDELGGNPGTYSNPLVVFKKAIDGHYSDMLNEEESVIKKYDQLSKGLTEESQKRLGIVLIRDQEGGMQRLLARTDLSTDFIKNVTLTPEEEKVRVHIRKFMDDILPRVESTMANMFNTEVRKVLNYFQFMTDYEALNDLKVEQRFELDIENMSEAQKQKYPGRSFTKHRGAAGAPVEINADKVFRAYVHNSLHLVNLGPALKKYQDIFNSMEFGGVVGGETQAYVKDYLESIARDGKAEPAQRRAWLDRLRANVGAGLVPFHISPALLHASKWFNCPLLFGMRKALSAAVEFSTNPDIREFMRVNVPEWRERGGYDDPTLQELEFTKYLSKINRKGLVPLRAAEQWSSGCTLWAAYKDVLEKKGAKVDLTKPDKDALLDATLLMRRAEGSPMSKDIPLAISTGRGLFNNVSDNRAVAQFKQFSWTRFSYMTHDIPIRFKRDKIDGAFASVYLASAFAAEMGARITGQWIQIGLLGLLGFETDKMRKKQEEKDSHYLKNFVEEIINTVPVVGQAFEMAKYGQIPVASLSQPVDAAHGVYQWSTAKTHKGEMMGAIKAFDAIGALLGLGVITQLGSLIMKIIREEQKPKYQANLDMLRKVPASMLTQSEAFEKGRLEAAAKHWEESRKELEIAQEEDDMEKMQKAAKGLQMNLEETHV